MFSVLVQILDSYILERSSQTLGFGDKDGDIREQGVDIREQGGDIREQGGDIREQEVMYQRI